MKPPGMTTTGTSRQATSTAAPAGFVRRVSQPKNIPRFSANSGTIGAM